MSYKTKKLLITLTALLFVLGIGTFAYAQTNIGKNFDYQGSYSIYNLQGISIGTTTVNNNAITFSDGTVFDQDNAGASWTSTSTGIIYDGGNVGIGVTDPNSKLDVNGAIYGSIFYDKDNTSYYVNPSGTSVFSGSLGIGTSPSAKLEVNRSNSTLGDAIKIRKSSDADQAWLSWAQGGEASGSWRMGYTGSPYDLTLNVGSASSLGTEIMKWGINGNVGIGTTNPGATLDVNGAVDVGSVLQIKGTQSACDGNQAGVIRYNGDFSGCNGSSWSSFTSGSGQWTRDSTNGEIYPSNIGDEVGIGTTNPDHKFDLEGTGVLAQIRNTGTGEADIRYVEDGDANADWQVGTGWPGSHFGNDAFFFYNSADIASLDSDGDFWASNSIRAPIFYDSNNTSYYVNPSGQSKLGGQLIINNDGSQLLLNTSTGGNRANIIADGGGTSAYLEFNVLDDDGGGWTETMRMVGDGNIGIGTTNPTRKLHVDGDILGNYDTWYNGRSSYYTDGRSSAKFYRSSSGGASYPFTEYGNAIIQAGDRSGSYGRDILFVTGATPSAKMVVKDTGSVGIGTISPDSNYKLTINGGGVHMKNYPVNYASQLHLNNGFKWTKYSSYGGFNNWLASQGSYGIYWPQVGGFTGTPHLAPSYTDSYGSLGIYGHKNNYRGLAIDSDFVIGMSDDSNTVGAYDDTDNEWIWLWQDANYFRLYAPDGSGYISLNSDAHLDMNGRDITSVDKIDANTVDPVYNIGDSKYATYMAGMTGVKEETTGSVTLTKDNQDYTHTIDFKELEKGSDLWIFYQTSDFGENWNNLSVLLTGDASVKSTAYYKLLPKEDKLVFYGEDNGRVSYRLTAPRFDHDKWSNDYEGDSKGLIVPEMK